MKHQRLILGCIADDFTGAGDMASFLRAGGLTTILSSGIPERQEIPDDTQAIVISLKSRTAPVGDAVRESLDGIRSLQSLGCTRFYIKYCSTFDSTPQGNIGPVLDAVLEYLGQEYTLLCPSLPVNGRTVKAGILLVNGVPLAKSPMKDHPLTPMWDSSIANLMKEQSKYPCVTLEEVYYQRSQEERDNYLRSRAGDSAHYYVIPDYDREEHAKMIVRAFADQQVLSGGSGLAAALAKKLSAETKHDVQEQDQSSTSGPALIVAGSVSKASIEQIKTCQEQGLACYKISPAALWYQTVTAETIWKAVRLNYQSGRNSVLVYCSGGPEDIRQGERYGKREFAQLLEDTLARLAQLAAAEGILRIIAAGGETSGAVTQKLGYRCFRIGQSIAPGVPVMAPVANRKMRLVLKSGNFGQPDFFIRALAMTGEV